VRLILGENAVRFLGLDRARLTEVADRIGPTVADITGGCDVAPELIAHFDLRGGYLKPAEGDAQLAMVDGILREDLAGLGAT